MNSHINQDPFDSSFFIKKYFIPLWEKLWLIIGIFCLIVVVSFLSSSFIKSEYLSTATLFIEKPTTELTKIKKDGEPESASSPYVKAQAEKMRSMSMASQVLETLSPAAKSDLLSPSATKYQLVNGFLDLTGKLLGTQFQKALTRILDFESEDATSMKIQVGRLQELKNRVEIIDHPRSSMIKITASSFQQEIAQKIVQAYLDVYLHYNLQENKESVRSKRAFISKQREKAYQGYKEAEQEMIDYRQSYGIPGDFVQARDIEIQLKLNRLESNLGLSKERYQYMDQMYMDIMQKEAGITNNLKILEHPTSPTTPSRKKDHKLRNRINILGFLVLIATILLLDYIKSPLRHEKDIQSAVQIPIIGYLPRIGK